MRLCTHRSECHAVDHACGHSTCSEVPELHGGVMRSCDDLGVLRRKEINETETQARGMPANNQHAITASNALGTRAWWTNGRILKYLLQRRPLVAAGEGGMAQPTRVAHFGDGEWELRLRREDEEEMGEGASSLHRSSLPQPVLLQPHSRMLAR